MDFVLENIDLTKMQNPAIVKTIVTSELGAEIARKKGLDVFSTLTGFKYIGEKITQFENAKINNELDKNYDFLMGYEESYGYLVGTHARDKDAVVASVLICEMAAKLKSEGKTLLNRMDEIYAEFGYYRDALDSYTLKGKDGLEKISSIMDELRREDFPFEDVVKAIDYNYPVKAEAGFGFLPTSNVLKYFLSDRSWVAIRPSGTEPKIKIYYSIIGENKIQADKKLKEIQARVGKKLKLEE